MSIKTNGYTQVKAHSRKEKKRKEADFRQGKYELLTLGEKIDLVNKRGGSKKELNRLSTPPKATPAVAPKALKVERASYDAETFVPEKKRKNSSKRSITNANKTMRPAKS